MAITDTPRSPAVAGRFYPGGANALRAEVSSYLELAAQNPVDLQGKTVLALMAPHAGYVFSGSVAGVTLGQAALPDRLLVLGPNHTGAGAMFSVWSGGPWQTPLGAMPVDEEAREYLLAAKAGFAPDTAAHAREHSLEVLVPFFQVAAPNARMTAIAVGGGSPEALRTAGEALAALMRDGAERGNPLALVVSSDMSHYLPHEKAAEQDALALKAVAELDPEGLYDTVRKRKISMCGVLPMTMALFACRALGATEGRIVAYATSGQTGRAYGADMSSVVGYAGAIVLR